MLLKVTLKAQLTEFGLLACSHSRFNIDVRGEGLHPNGFLALQE